VSLPAAQVPLTGPDDNGVMTQRPAAPNPSRRTGSSVRRRWGRTWRSRVATGVAGVVGVAAGAAVISVTDRPASGAATITPGDGAGTTEPSTAASTVPRRVGNPPSVYGGRGSSRYPQGVDPDGDDWTGGGRVVPGGSSTYRVPTQQTPRPQGSTRASR